MQFCVLPRTSFAVESECELYSIARLGWSCVFLTLLNFELPVAAIELGLCNQTAPRILVQQLESGDHIIVWGVI